MFQKYLIASIDTEFSLVCQLKGKNSKLVCCLCGLLFVFVVSLH